MHSRTHKWFLVMIALALAVAPLRGAWTMPMPTGTDSPSHCAQMDMPATDMLANMQEADTETGHKCEQGCNSDCCEGACNKCAQGAPTLPGTNILTLDFHDAHRNVMSLSSFPERITAPPLRPPVTL